MDSQTVLLPAVNTVYPFRTVTLSGSTYRIENRTPYTLYIVNKSVASVEDCIRQAQITVLPMNAASLAYVDTDYISCVLTSDVAQISLPQDVTTFLRMTTFLQTENAIEQQTNSAIATYNPASLEVNALSSSEAVQAPPANTATVIQLPANGLDLYGWNGAYFTFDCSASAGDSVYGFIQQSDNSTFANPVATVRYFAGNTGLIYIPRFYRYLKIWVVTSPEWSGGNLETSIRRTVAEIDPLIQLRQTTFAWFKDYTITAGQSRAFYLPVLPPVTRVTIINNNANRVVFNRMGETLDGSNSSTLDCLVVKASKAMDFYIETNVAFFLHLTNESIGSDWSCRMLTSY